MFFIICCILKNLSSIVFGSVTLAPGYLPRGIA